jgi:hypothetical protein
MPRPSSSSDRAVGVQRHVDRRRMRRQRLVGSVVYHFLDDVQRAFGAGVHARPLLHGLEPLQHLDRCFAVTACLGCHGEAF